MIKTLLVPGLYGSPEGHWQRLWAASDPAAVIVDQASGHRFEATRGGGARVDGRTLRPSGCAALGDAIVGLSGYPPLWFGWKQFRALGAAALDLCAVAAGQLDAYVDCSPSAHGAWDYLGGMLVCQEAGAVIVDAYDRPLVTTDHAARRTPIAAGTAALLDAAVAARRTFADQDAWASERPLRVGLEGPARSVP